MVQLLLGSFRYGNVILSESITLSGQRIIQESALTANREMNKEISSIMKHIEDTPWWICDPEETNYCAYSDTDSIYMHAESLLRHRHSMILMKWVLKREG